jgi:anti-sigma B factor antagonist
VSGNGLLSWNVTQDAAAVVVRVAGDIDLASEGEFAEALSDGLSRAVPVLLVDLSDVTFLGSAGLHVLLEANRDAVQQRCSLRIAHGGAFAARVLDVAGLDQVLAVFESPELALGSAGGAQAPDRRHDLGIRDAL